MKNKMIKKIPYDACYIKFMKTGSDLIYERGGLTNYGIVTPLNSFTIDDINNDIKEDYITVIEYKTSAYTITDADLMKKYDNKI